MIHFSTLLLLFGASVADAFPVANPSVAGRPGSSLYVHNPVVGANTSPSTNGKEASRKKTAVIVGAGPAGLAAALVLSKVKKAGSTNFFDRVVVLEDAPDGDRGSPMRSISI
uniref:Amine oxidase domain-containing protein n=1 Tax=Ditylum brightwellii TaxID=49249 RepID=A0A7S4T8B7_9STRA|mmetsp:Transcript_20216/g.29695  ORF Transcript_20216/g.29695 Transcript_20216/m.29695 type:complete len:112 (+) Transcript_20216:176-511(+)